MEKIFCSICKSEQTIHDCWCVIDTKTKERYYECKKKCIAPTPFSDTNTITNLKELEIRPPSDTKGEEVDDFPSQGVFERALAWFSNGYTKIKME